LNKNFEEALECYSKAIEMNDKDPAFYTNSKIGVYNQVF